MATSTILQAHSLRPHTLEGHLALYRTVLHHTGNRLPLALLELVGVFSSMLNRCTYCVEHHFVGLRRALHDEARANAFRRALEEDDLENATFDTRERAALDYCAVLTRKPWEVDAAMLDGLRAAGFDDGEILELDQVIAYFAYANRTVLGLGVTLAGDTLGLSPAASDDPFDWRHG